MGIIIKEFFGVLTLPDTDDFVRFSTMWSYDGSHWFLEDTMQTPVPTRGLSRNIHKQEIKNWIKNGQNLLTSMKLNREGFKAARRKRAYKASRRK